MEDDQDGYKIPKQVALVPVVLEEETLRTGNTSVVGLVVYCLGSTEWQKRFGPVLGLLASTPH